MDGQILRLANAAATRMRREGIPPVEAVSAAYKEQYGGKGFEDELKRAALRELGRRGGKKAAIVRKEAAIRKQDLLRRMIHESHPLAFQRRDHLLPDP